MWATHAAMNKLALALTDNTTGTTDTKAHAGVIWDFGAIGIIVIVVLIVVAVLKKK